MTSPIKIYKRAAVLALAAGALLRPAFAADPTPALEQGFVHPPASARPWVYLFPLDGNISSNGITADLEAMQRVGIGGVLYMETDQGAPKGPARFGGPLWRDLFKHLCAEANRLGLEVNMNNDAGWCGSGGPWIPPELSMQKIVWTETNLAGPLHFDAPLAQPQAVADYYRDIAVYAFPALAGDGVRMAAASPKITASASGAAFDAKKLLDGDAKTSVTLPRPTRGKPQWFQVEFPQRFTARMLTLTPVGSGKLTARAALQVSDDGKTFRTIRDFGVGASAVSVSFPDTKARFFRVLFTSADAKLKQVTIAELELNPRFRIEDIAGKALFVPQKEFSGHAEYPVLADGLAVKRGQLLNLTARLGPDGRLAWDVPPGRWTVVRFGHTSTGKDNHPAPLEGRGLECDKLSKEAATAAFDGLMGKLIADNGPLVGKTLVSTHIDSWEVGSQNWTPKMREDFQRLRGYDPMPFLPVMTGRVVDSLEVSERFLWDWRQTISDLIVDNYAGQFRDLAHQNGLRLSIEAYDGNPCDDLVYAGRADEPMGEFWSWAPYGAAYSCTEMASAAHVYGKKILGAEAFTANDGERWQGHPYSVKAYGDWAFCEGINRFVVHRYALQPWTNPDRKPGMSMGPWGLHYERSQTWWEQSKAWHEYLARCQYLLRQGLFVADICYLAPEKAPQRWQPPQPSLERPSYNFDGCPAEVVLTRMSVKNGRLVLPDGMSYRVLVLPESETMTPRLLRKITELVQAGATVIGARPLKSPSLTDYPKCDDEVKRLADALWGADAKRGAGESGSRRVGKGVVIWGQSPEEVLAGMGVAPDFLSQPKLRCIHRAAEGAEIYFVANPHPAAISAAATFRVGGKVPELWWPDTGRIERAGVYEPTKATTRVALSLDPRGSVFVVFRQAVTRLDPAVSLTRDGKPVLSTRPAQRAGITVQRAVYGVPGDPQRTRDVRDKVQRLADVGETDFVVARMAEGDDPAYGIVKTLVVDYAVGGRKITASATDPEHLQLVEAAAAEPLPADVRCDAGDRLMLEARQPGHYEAQTEHGQTLRADVSLPAPQEITGPWQVRFDPKWGGPDVVTFDQLDDWSKRPEDGIRHYSGAAIYRKTFVVPDSAFRAPHSAFDLDLGKVAVIAEVKLNGQDLGILWKPPFCVDVTDGLKPGENQLEVRVVNLWINRQIGDQALPEDSDRNPNGTLKAWPEWLGEGKPSPTGRFTFTSWRLYKQGDALVESGLLGPVTLQPVARISLQPH